MGFFADDGTWVDEPASFDAGGGGSNWGAPDTNSSPGSFWTNLGQNITGFVGQLPPPAPFDGGGGGSYWGNDQPNYEWTAPAQPDYSNFYQSFDGGGGGSSWGGNDNSTWISEPSASADNWGWSNTGDWSAAQPDYATPAWATYAQTGVDTYSGWDKLAQGIGGYLEKHGSGPTFYSPQQMFSASQQPYNPVSLDSSTQHQQFTQLQKDIYTAPGELTDTYANSNVDWLSAPARSVQSGWNNYIQPVMDFTPSVVGDISEGRAPGLFSNLYNYLTDPNYTEQARQRKAGYVQEAYDQAIAAGYAPEQASNMAQALDQKLNNFANFSEYEGMRRFGQLPEWAQAGVRMADPVMWGALGYAGKFARNRAVIPGEEVTAPARPMNFEAPEVSPVKPGPAPAPPAAPALDTLPSVDYYSRTPFVKQLQESVMQKGQLPANLRQVEQGRLAYLKQGGGTPESYMQQVMDAAQRDGLNLDEIWKASGQRPPTAPTTAPAVAAPKVHIEPEPASVEFPPESSRPVAPKQEPLAPSAKGQPAQLPQVEYSNRVEFYENLKDSLKDAGKKTKNLQQAVNSRIAYLQNGGTEAGYIERLSKAAAKDGLSLDKIWQAAGKEAPANLPSKLSSPSKWKQKALLYGVPVAGAGGAVAVANYYKQNSPLLPTLPPPNSTPPTTRQTDPSPVNSGVATKTQPISGPVVTTSAPKVNPVTIEKAELQPPPKAPGMAATSGYLPTPTATLAPVQPQPYKQQVKTYQTLQKKADTLMQAANYYAAQNDYEKVGEIMNHPNFNKIVYAPMQYRAANRQFYQKYRSQNQANTDKKIAPSNQPDIETIREMLRRPVQAIVKTTPSPNVSTARPVSLPFTLNWLRENSKPLPIIVPAPVTHLL